MELIGLLLLFVIALVGFYLKLPTVKGARGERRVSSVLSSRLPSAEYSVFDDLTLNSSRGKTQIDHVVVSPYGVFVIETKNYSGWIFGSARAKQWTQVLYRKKYQFMNPLHQNYKHVQAVKGFLGLDSKSVHSVVVFVGGAEFKTALPDNVVYLSRLLSHLRSWQENRLSESRVTEIISQFTNLEAGEVAAEGASSLAVMATEPDCPRCGTPMVRRTAKQGSNAGNDFWGCPGFPGCRGVRSMSSEPDEVMRG